MVKRERYRPTWISDLVLIIKTIFMIFIISFIINYHNDTIMETFLVCFTFSTSVSIMGYVLMNSLRRKIYHKDGTISYEQGSF